MKADSLRHMLKALYKGIADGIRVFGLPLDHEDDDGSKTYNLAYVITINNEFNILYVSLNRFDSPDPCVRSTKADNNFARRKGVK